jgi:hypothetical protein
MARLLDPSDSAGKHPSGLSKSWNNAAYQMTHETLEEITDEEWDYTFRINVGAMFYLVKAALPHMKKGASIVASSSVNSDKPSPTLAPYAATKAAIANFSAGRDSQQSWHRYTSCWPPTKPATCPELGTP